MGPELARAPYGAPPQIAWVTEVGTDRISGIVLAAGEAVANATDAGDTDGELITVQAFVIGTTLHARFANSPSGGNRRRSKHMAAIWRL
jgi:hypothetical protein